MEVLRVDGHNAVHLVEDKIRRGNRGRSPSQGSRPAQPGATAAVAQGTVGSGDVFAWTASGVDWQLSQAGQAESETELTLTQMQADAQASGELELLRAGDEMDSEWSRAAALDGEDGASLRLTADEKQREKGSATIRMGYVQGDRELQWAWKAEDFKVQLLEAGLNVVQVALGIVECVDPTGLAAGVNAVTSYLRGNELDAVEFGVASLSKAGTLISSGTKLAKVLCIGTRLGSAAIGTYRTYVAFDEGDWLQLGFSAVSFLRFLRTACFAGGTQVVVGIDSAGGYITRDIEQIQVGDWVLSQDQDDPAAEPVLRQVTGVEEHTVYGIRILQVRDEETGDVESIRVTEEHPFWVVGFGWKGAGDLRPGDRLLNPDGTCAVVVDQALEAHPEGLAVYNLTVEGDHTYFVEDGQGQQSPVWVHNSCTPISLLRNSQGRILAKNYTVYVAMKGDQVVYVGMTRQLLKDRLRQHLATGRAFDDLRPIAESLTRRQARAIEQTLIRQNPQFLNDIGSISPTRTWYMDAVKWGMQWVARNM